MWDDLIADLHEEEVKKAPSVTTDVVKIQHHNYTFAIGHHLKVDWTQLYKKIRFLDSNVYCVSYEFTKYWIGKIAEFNYIKSKRDCDNAAINYMHSKPYIGCPGAVLMIELPPGGELGGRNGHVMNLAYCTDKRLYLIEPQRNEIFPCPNDIKIKWGFFTQGWLPET
jgi:hypothetical protein